eukprot:3524063-Amphidinium_carterae.1
MSLTPGLKTYTTTLSHRYFKKCSSAIYERHDHNIIMVLICRSAHHNVMCTRHRSSQSRQESRCNNLRPLPKSHMLPTSHRLTKEVEGHTKTTVKEIPMTLHKPIQLAQKPMV